MLHFVNDMLRFTNDLLRLISSMIGSNGAFHHSDQNMWKWIRISLDGSESKRLKLLPKINRGEDAKKPSELWSGDKQGQFWIVAVEERGRREKVQSLVCFLDNFAVVLDTLSWPDNSCPHNEM